MIRPKKGDVVQITFLDHCHTTGDNGYEPHLCQVWGRVFRFTKDHIVVDAWHALKPDGRNNCEVFTILRANIKDMVRLVPEQGGE